jgi:hypothetical protein
MNYFRFAALLLLTLSQIGELSAQTLHATIRGQVLENAGSPRAGVTVTATNEETGEARQAVSDPEGAFTISLLPPGSYKLEAEAQGFRKYAENGVLLQVGQNLRIRVRLAAGGPSELIIVTAKTGVIKQDTASMGQVIDNPKIMNLPLDGRNFLELSLLVPGSSPAAQGSPGSVRGEFSVNAGGGREDSNNFLLDGAFNNDPKLNTFAINPPADAIREFEILTGAYDASFGRSGGAQVNVVLKSGANKLHGTAYEFIRNAALDARNFFAPAGAAPRYQRNQYGFSLGGPIRKNRSFFFADYEGRRVREGITYITNVPTALEREGDFSQSIFARPFNPYAQAPFGNGKIPVEYQSPVGRKIAALYPLPNRAVAGQNYVSSPILRDSDDRFDARLDHSMGSHSTLIGRYSFSDRSLYEPFSGAGFSRIPGFGTNVPRRAQNFMVEEDHTFSASFINQARFALNRVSGGVFQEARTPGGVNSAVGLPELSAIVRDRGLSFITISGYSPIGDEYNNPQHSTTNVFQFSNTVTLAHGRHLFKLGGEYRALQQNAFRDIQARGLMAFSDYGQVTGNGLADMLLGFVTYSGGAHLDNPQYLRTRSLNFFAQDSYRILQNLTLQLGVRYEFNSPPVDRYNRANIYDASKKALVSVGTNGVPRSGYESDKNNIAPRIGLAWSPGNDNRLVVRAGYGFYFDQSSLAPGEGLYFNKPYYDFRLYFPLPGLPLTIGNPFPAYYPLEIPASALGFDRNLRSPYFQHWNLGIMRQIGTSGVFEIAYAGSIGTKILSARDINQPAASPAQPNPRPVPQFADINYLESRGKSSYHSLQSRFQHRFQAGFDTLVSYTYSKSIDQNSTFFSSFGDANFPQSSSNPGAEKGRSNFDLRHRLSVGYSYDLPMGKGHKMRADDGFFSALISGWSTHGILTVQSGRPFTIALLPEIDNSNTGIGSLGFGANNRPMRTADGELDNPNPDRWFDASAFSFAKYGSFGNSGRNILDGPSYQDLSLSLMKDSALKEDLRIQFRAEFFNSLNHANFGLPDIFLGSPTFGRVQSAASPRRIQFGLKLIF